MSMKRRRVEAAKASEKRNAVKPGTWRTRSRPAGGDAGAKYPKWRHKPVYKSNGDKYYESVALDETTKVSVGDYVAVLVEDHAGRETLAIAVVESMWEDRHRERKAEARWFSFPSETKVGRARAQTAGELFETDQVGEISLDAINAKVQVLPKHVFAEFQRERLAMREDSEGDLDEEDDERTRQNGPTPAEDPEASVFFCEHFYHAELDVLRPSQLLTRSRRNYLYSERLRDADFGAASNELLAEEGSDGETADPFSKALKLLQLSAIPPSLPCREAERKQIFNFVQDGVARSSGGSLYISGMPGTGKTVTVHEVVRSLRAQAELGKIPRFDFVEVNGMKLRHPYDAYSVIYQALTGEQVNHVRAGQLLEQMFSGPEPSSPSNRTCVLLVDELDYMVTKKQTVLYNLFDWPARPGSWLVCVGIANTMDLPERLLPRIHSRMGMSRVVFRSYDYAQLETIVAARLCGLEVFDEGAVQFCAKRVASVSGDIRRALQICRKAVEHCKARSGVADAAARVTIEDVKLASNELRNSAVKQALRKVALLDKIICASMYKRLRMQDSDEVGFEDLFRNVSALWKQYCSLSNQMASFAPLTKLRVRAACNQLGAANLLTVTQRSDDRVPSLRLGTEVSLHDIKDALSDDDQCRELF